jgi:transcriptional antiterminator NusG
MSNPTDESIKPTSESSTDEPESQSAASDVEVEEETPAGGQPEASAPERSRSAGEPSEAIDDGETTAAEGSGSEEPESADTAATDDEPEPELVWYVLKVQSSREDTIRDALQRRVKIQALEKYFGKDLDGKPRIVVPTEKITEIRNNKKRIVERKTYPGYIMVQMELNEKTWFLVRETPGVGDFVGAHGTPTKMTDTEVNQMLHQEEEKTTAETPKVRIDVERGDRVKIKDGPFENFEGTVEEVIEGRGLVKVMLIIFNRPTPVDLEYWQLERI